MMKCGPMKRCFLMNKKNPTMVRLPITLAVPRLHRPARPAKTPRASAWEAARLRSAQAAPRRDGRSPRSSAASRVSQLEKGGADRRSGTRIQTTKFSL